MPLPWDSLGERLNIIAEKICFARYISLRTIWGHENKGKELFCLPTLDHPASPESAHSNMWSFHRGSCLCSGAPKSKPAGFFSRSRIMDVLRAELCCFTRKSCQHGVLWFPRACALFLQPSNDFQPDKILPLPPKLISFSKEPLLLRSTNITKRHPYKLLNGNGYRKRLVTRLNNFRR